MPRMNCMKATVVATLVALVCQSASVADIDPCTRFKWDVSHEVAVMKAAPQAITAATRPGADVPLLKLNTPYTLKLADQIAVTFATSPAKAAMAQAATAGITRFRTERAGRYRVSITSGHWIDIVDGTELLKSVDFQGHVGCERPRKIVEYELPADRELGLQLSGSNGAEVVMAITVASSAAAS